MSSPPRVLLDACVLFPNTLREILLGAAAAGRFAPLWSARILEEWARATRRLPTGAESIARSEIARMQARWPDAEVRADPELEARLSLPDQDDLHVLASAVTAGADVLLTLNRRDFPSRTLARHGVIRRDPDSFLCELLDEWDDISVIVDEVSGRRADPAAVAVRGFLKRAGLPRLGKALEARSKPTSQRAEFSPSRSKG